VGVKVDLKVFFSFPFVSKEPFNLILFFLEYHAMILKHCALPKIEVQRYFLLGHHSRSCKFNFGQMIWDKI
jgi:hypothetical protein